ncbi:NAD(P)H-binding protein [Streptacidiphilus sp. N1-12]|uniref:NAD(P)H-binding protein n=2 Tax=Streptacidiphilus alkalitolerans TaxID=3342712 RepID=A0ABV6WH17_9ACTN
MTILVTGARGHVARSLVQQLLAADPEVKVRAAGRVPEAVRLPVGVELVRADLAEPATLGPALTGAAKVFLYAEQRGLRGFVTEAQAAGVAHIVLLSAAGADPASEDAITRAHGEAEQTVARSGIPWTFLRPGGFATNRLLWADTVRTHGVVHEAFPDSHSSLIHEADIAAVALHALTEPGHHGKAHTLTGPESLTGRRHVELLAEAIGRPLRIEPQSLDDYRRALSRWPPEIVEARIRRIAALVDRPAPVTDTVREVTGHPARSFATWAADHTADFGRSAA